MTEMYAALEIAKDRLESGHPVAALAFLSIALGHAKRLGRGYEAGRILTAIRQAKRIGGA